MGQLASSVGRTAASVRRWERDEAVPDVEVVDQLAEALELDPSQLSDLATQQEPEEDSDELSDPFGAIPGSGTGAIPITPPAATEVTPEIPAEDDSEPHRVKRFFDALFDPDKAYLGYMRAVLTVVLAAVLLYVLVWAAGQLLDALGQVWDSFGSE